MRLGLRAYANFWDVSGVYLTFICVVLNFNDHTKVRLQIQGAHGITRAKHLGYVGMARHIAVNEGWRALFLRGMTPSIIREMTYSSVRMGLYDPIRNALASDGRTPFNL